MVSCEAREKDLSRYGWGDLVVFNSCWNSNTECSVLLRLLVQQHCATSNTSVIGETHSTEMVLTTPAHPLQRLPRSCPQATRS
eukprot:5309120-Amphidinium_carterae.1